jgi:dTMP kinase
MATQPTKGKGAWEGNEKEESVWEEVVRMVRKREKEELERKRQEEIAKKKAEDDRMQREYQEYLWREKKRNEKLQAERDRLWREKFQRNWQLAQLARERANRMHLEEVAKEAERIKEERAQAEASKTEERHHFFDSVVQLARDIRGKKELAEESKKKKARGEGAFATQ